MKKEELDKFEMELWRENYPILNRKLRKILKDMFSSQTQDIKKRITKKEELHTHNSIPSFTGDLENWCVICIRNQAIEDILKMLDE